MKILFLDFDGVIATNRAYIANGVLGIEDHDVRWIDPIATTLIANLCVKYDYQIVVTSTWRKFGIDRCVKALGPLAMHLHCDWRTKEIWPKGPYSSADSRPTEIADWKLRNQHFDEYLILDDDSFRWTEHQRTRWVQTDTTNGFSTENYEQVINANRTK